MHYSEITEEPMAAPKAKQQAPAPKRPTVKRASKGGVSERVARLRAAWVRRAESFFISCSIQTT